MTRLSVNINKIALLRNARGSNIPDLIQFAIDCERYGAEGITVHPRPDERHIRFDDVYALKDVVSTEYNIEGYPSDHFVRMVTEVCPHQVTLVPDPPDALTSNAGWDSRKHFSLLQEVIGEFKSKGIRTSLFMENDKDLILGAKEAGADRIELYTGPYAEDFEQDKEKAIAPYAEAADYAGKEQIGLNAGHDLNLDNLKFFKERVNGLLEVSIGQALVRDCLYFGLENTIMMYKQQLL